MEISSGDTAWVLVSTALVLVMVPGLAFFYGGLVRGKSALNTMLMCIAALAVVTVQWVVFGYSLAFGEGSRWMGDLSYLGLRGVGAEGGPYASAIPHVLFAAFQGMFAGIAVALFSGAIVERMRFGAYLVFGVLWTTFVYDPLAHWVWGEGGWLRELGALDFAGGTVVHIVRHDGNRTGAGTRTASRFWSYRHGAAQRAVHVAGCRVALVWLVWL